MKSGIIDVVDGPPYSVLELGFPTGGVLMGGGGADSRCYSGNVWVKMKKNWDHLGGA